MTAAPAPNQVAAPVTPEELYLDLIKKCLTRFVFGEHYQSVDFRVGTLRHRLFGPMRSLLARRHLELVKRHTFDPAVRMEGRDWPSDGETMIGLKRLDNIEFCMREVIRERVPGDVIEAGVWRGGAVIFMRAVLKAYGDTTRRVWAADSFQGLPRPDPAAYPADAGDPHWSFAPLAVSLEQVKANFARYGLLDDQVRFLPGWFKDTLAAAPIERLSLMRLDGDMYESTMDALVALYPRLSVGGFVIVDDYGVVPACKKAIHDYRDRMNIVDPIQPIDDSGVFWRKAPETFRPSAE